MNIIAFIFSIFLLSIAFYCQQKMLKLSDGVDKILAWFVLFPTNIIRRIFIMGNIWKMRRTWFYFHIMALT